MSSYPELHRGPFDRHAEFYKTAAVGLETVALKFVASEYTGETHQQLLSLLNQVVMEASGWTLGVTDFEEKDGNHGFQVVPKNKDEWKRRNQRLEELNDEDEGEQAYLEWQFQESADNACVCYGQTAPNYGFPVGSQARIVTLRAVENCPLLVMLALEYLVSRWHLLESKFSLCITEREGYPLVACDVIYSMPLWDDVTVFPRTPSEKTRKRGREEIESAIESYKKQRSRV